MPAIRLYDYAASCNCYKIRLLLAQLEVDHERIGVDIFAGETLTEAFATINPARAVPVLERPDGRRLSESGAILTYLAQDTPLLPEDPFDRAQVLRWLLFEQADLLPVTGGLRFRLQTGRWAADAPEARARHAAGVGVLGLLEDHLRDRRFLVADTYTIADIAVYGYTHVAHEAGLPMDDFPAIDAWLTRVARQPRYMNDMVPYPPNASVRAGRSIYG